jgi:hypothetical protein
MHRAHFGGILGFLIALEYQTVTQLPRRHPDNAETVKLCLRRRHHVRNIHVTGFEWAMH